MNFAKFSLGAFALTVMLVACDSDSASAKDTEIEELSSSSAVEIASSSSTIRNDNSSSSSETTQSSSSTAAPCNVDGENNCNYGTLTDTRDGKTYKTVTIGDQTWMAENLNYADSVKTPSLKGKSWCYDGAAANCEKYGRLYTWAAAKTVCPEGWHLPSYDEWNTLFTAVGGKSTAGAKLKSQTGWAAYDGITNEDSFGFSALPAGNRYDNGSYYYEGYDAHFWSSTEYGSYDAYYMSLGYDYGDAYLDNNDKSNGHSVRCVKD